MVVFLILILIFALFITYLLLNAKKTTESYNNYQPFRGRAPDGPPGCCGNLDWYMGSENTHNIAPGKIKIVVAKNWRNTSAISKKICQDSIARLTNVNRRGWSQRIIQLFAQMKGMHMNHRQIANASIRRIIARSAMGRLILDTDLALHNREEARFPLPYTNKSLAIF